MNNRTLEILITNVPMMTIGLWAIYVVCREAIPDMVKAVKESANMRLEQGKEEAMKRSA